MSDRVDLLKSLLRAAASRAGSELRRVAPLGAVRRALADALAQRAAIGDDTLTAAVAHADGVRAASVTARGGAIQFDVVFADARQLAAALVPLEPRFAPRGAKELRFRVEPPEAARDPRVAGVAAAVAGAVARALWGVLVAGRDDAGAAIVDREGDELRVDLRTVPAVRRRVESRAPLGAVIDVMGLGALRAEDGRLTLELSLPQLLR